MRRSPFARPVALAVSAAAALSIFASTITPSSAAVAPPAKPKTTRPTAKPAKPPKLAGEVVESEALDMRLVIPEGWEPFTGKVVGIPKGAKSITYHRPKFIERTAVTQYYYPPQFFAFALELPETERTNNLTPAQQDEMMQGLMSSIYKTQPNFRSEGMAHVTVNGEPATACAYVNTGNVTGDILRYRIVGMLRNHKLYVFGFIAEINDFPNLSPTFAKILENFQFMTPRKKDVPPPPAPGTEPVQKEGTL